MLVLIAVTATCTPVDPTRPAASASGQPSGPPRPSLAPPGEASAGAGPSASPASPRIDAGVGRLVWLADSAGRFGMWTTDLAGGDVRAFASGLDEAGTALREPVPIGDDVVVLRDTPTTTELWLMSQATPPRLLLDRVVSFVAIGEREVAAVRDIGDRRSIWRVPLDGGPPTAMAELPVPDQGPQVGPFGFAISPDGRTVAAGWVGGLVEVVGPAPASLRDVGAPLVVADDGRLVAVAGRAGEAYLIENDRMVELAPSESDPLATPGSGSLAWASVGEDGALRSVEVRDLLAGTSETYPAGGLATNVRALTASHVILEATAFDPLVRTVALVDRLTGGFTTFEAAAPVVD